MKRDDRRDVGVIWDEAKQPDSCSCHISPPCSACTDMHETIGGADLWSDLTDQDVSECEYERFVPLEQLQSLETAIREHVNLLRGWHSAEEISESLNRLEALL